LVRKIVFNANKLVQGSQLGLELKICLHQVFDLDIFLWTLLRCFLPFFWNLLHLNLNRLKASFILDP